MAAADRYRVRIHGLHEVRYRDARRTVRFEANMRDREVYLGNETVEGEPMTEAERQHVIRRIYDHVNKDLGRELDFLNADGSIWGEAHSRTPRPLPPEEVARQNEEARRLREDGPWYRRALRFLGGGR